MYWITGILGLALAAAPYVLGYSSNTVALYMSLILGLAVVVVSAAEFFQADKQEWEYWVAGLAGLVAIVAPFIFNFSTQQSAMWTSVVAGVLLAIVAGSRIFTGQPKAT